jgi:hypothetical protein
MKRTILAIVLVALAPAGIADSSLDELLKLCDPVEAENHGEKAQAECIRKNLEATSSEIDRLVALFANQIRIWTIQT